MIDVQLLRIMKVRNEFLKVFGRIPVEAIEPTTRVIIKDFQKYYKAHPAHQTVDRSTFMPMFFAWHSKMKTEQRNAYTTLLNRVFETDVPPTELDAIMQTLLELRLGADMQKLLIEFNEGNVENMHGSIDTMLGQFRIDARVKGIDFLRPDVEGLLSQDENDEGLRSRLEAINRCMRPLRPGDFGITAARPDRGKTTWLASETTFWAAQSDKPIIWLNNEGPGQRIYPRLWQAALGKPMTELIRLHQRNRLITEYEAAIKGDQHKIRVFDIHGMDTYAVERILDNHPSCAVVFDMIDNIRGFGSEARTDLMLEKMYQWAREMCVKYETAGVATSQISVDGANMQFPQDHMLKDSKTGKQGACDFILMIGNVDDPGYARQRFLGLPKNKLRREGAEGDPRTAVSYKPEIARYADPAIVGTDEGMPDE